ncbi:short-chain dehydrogenase [Asanoa ishikariensis]|uniref:Short-chain dehydrogenase n=1 Tax=Asanoa ishikariensis TaxID=137265 RepID=A0A1H3R558_9ACTN|nr:SDR family oxidoreductase [Asanoa ishikariensis]GIF64434.1 short-chain dehydrogenase [Asanoa ishikariensis]SDZ20445.1 Short-chain dehydrogenase [Asanoa ishikariensis]
MQINGATVLVTGGNRGLGKAFVEEFLDRGAKTVYAAARDPRTVTNTRAIPIQLDVTDRASIERAAAIAGDVTLLVNNAGTDTYSRSFVDGDRADIQREFDTNLFGPLDVTRAFAPVIIRNGGGHLLNVASVLSWLPSGAYGAAKAALWSATNHLRAELAPQGVGVTGLYVGYIDTDLAAHVTLPKSDPRVVARAGIDGIEAGVDEVLADEFTRAVRGAIGADPTTLLS